MKTSLVQVLKGICLFIGLSSLTSFVSGREAPDRVILFIIDGLSVEALRWPAQPALFRRAPDRASGRRQDLHEARRAEPYGRAQDQ